MSGAGVRVLEPGRGEGGCARETAAEMIKVGLRVAAPTVQPGTSCTAVQAATCCG